MRPSLEIAKERFKEKKKTDYNAVVGVEIGVLKGANAKEILEEFPNLFILHLVDSYMGRYPYYYHDARMYLKKYDDRIVWHITTSWIAVNSFDDSTLDFVYIDNGHTHELVKGDVNRWWPKVKIGGMLCGHDYVLPGGVQVAVDEFVKENNLTLYTGKESDWWIFR